MHRVLFQEKSERKQPSNLRKAHETRDSLSSSYSQVVLMCLYPFRRNSLLKSTPQPQIAWRPFAIADPNRLDKRVTCIFLKNSVKYQE